VRPAGFRILLAIAAPPVSCLAPQALGGHSRPDRPLQGRTLNDSRIVLRAAALSQSAPAAVRPELLDRMRDNTGHECRVFLALRFCSSPQRPIDRPARSYPANDKSPFVQPAINKSGRGSMEVGGEIELDGRG